MRSEAEIREAIEFAEEAYQEAVECCDIEVGMAAGTSRDTLAWVLGEHGAFLELVEGLRARRAAKAKGVSNATCHSRSHPRA